METTDAWTQDWGNGTEGYLYCVLCCVNAATDGRGNRPDEWPHEEVLASASGTCGIVFDQPDPDDVPADAACAECGAGLVPPAAGLI